MLCICIMEVKQFLKSTKNQKESIKRRREVNGIREK